MKLFLLKTPCLNYVTEEKFSKYIEIIELNEEEDIYEACENYDEQGFDLTILSEQHIKKIIDFYNNRNNSNNNKN